ncbi:hypothetical protein OEA41_006904 [Lepraria neglecta]|uniref:Uncharacterized protein n=1 Tax=Lepraria neglecta TaxID=209136 RepID=A0AAD9ZCA3_9LECA|nr:hypothetical protein OEA41_006904 [Lepraria neglecta]
MNRKWISAGSVRAYRSDHMNADLTENDTFTNALADLIADDPGQIASLIGQLPAEWYPISNPHSPGLHQHISLTPNPNRTLPVCDGGKNYYGWDYVTMVWKSVNNQTKPAIGNGGVHRAGGWPLQVPHQWVPCACGFRGNEREIFDNASSIAKLGGGFFGLAIQSCDMTIAQNNSQGFLQLNGGQPPNHKVTLAERYTYTMTEKSAPAVQSDPPPFV